MNTIGSYIHARLARYQKLGIDRYYGRSNTLSPSSVVSKINAQRNKLKSISNLETKTEKDAIKTELTNYLNKIFTGGKSDYSDFQKNLYSALEKDLIEQYGKNVRKINFENLDVDKIVVKELNQFEKELDIIRKRADRTQLRASTVAKRLILINKYADYLSKEIATAESIKKANAMAKQVEKFTNELKNLVNIQGKTKNILQTLVNDNTNKYMLKFNNPKENNLIDEVNVYIKELTYSVVTHQKGDLFEAALAGFNAQIASLTGAAVEEAITDAIKQHKVGSNRSKSVYLSSNFFTTPKNWKKDFKNGDIEMGFSQDKTDVTISLDTIINKNLKHLEANISAKNVNLSKNAFPTISLVSGTPLLYLFQEFGNNDLINHYLNLTLPHIDDGTKNVRKISSSSIAAARISMKQAIFLQAVKGVGDKHKTVDFIVINNNTSNKKNSFYILTIDEILRKAYKDINNISVLNQNDEKFESGFKLTNPWQEPDYNDLNAAEARIAEILAELHRQKIYVSIRKSVIKN